MDFFSDECIMLIAQQPVWTSFPKKHYLCTISAESEIYKQYFCFDVDKHIVEPNHSSSKFEAALGSKHHACRIYFPRWVK